MTISRARKAWLAGCALLLASTATHAVVESPDGFAVHDSPRSIPEIPFEKDDGEAMTLADFRGKVVVLNLWATWCPPCRREMPTLDALQAKLGSQRFEVVALSVDRAGPSIVREFFADEGVEHLALYIDTSARALSRLGVPGIPTTLVLDTEGREIARLTGEADWATPEMLDYFRDLIDKQTEGDES